MTKLFGQEPGQHSEDRITRGDGSHSLGLRLFGLAGGWNAKEMKEVAERIVQIGFKKKPAKVLDEIEKTTKEMAAQGWSLTGTKSDEILEHILLFFEREIQEE